MRTTDIAVIGAGTAGCLAARLLRGIGRNLILVEKSRGMGGRCSRRSANGYSLDLGAATIQWPAQGNAAHPGLQPLMDELIASKQLLPWQFQLGQLQSPADRAHVTELCAPGNMSQLHHTLCQGIPLLTNTLVERISRTQKGSWHLWDALGNPIVEAAALVVCTPAQQALRLFDWTGDWHDLITRAAKRSQPQWVCALEFDQHPSALADIYRGSHESLSQAVRDSAKPKRDKGRDVWVLHSTFEWARERLDLLPEQAGALLAADFCATTGARTPYRVLTSHRWLLAHHDCTPVNPGYLWSPTLKLGLCADWLGGGGVLGAMHSAQALANQVIHPVSSGDSYELCPAN